VGYGVKDKPGGRSKREACIGSDSTGWRKTPTWARSCINSKKKGRREGNGVGRRKKTRKKASLRKERSEKRNLLLPKKKKRELGLKGKKGGTLAQEKGRGRGREKVCLIVGESGNKF